MIFIRAIDDINRAVKLFRSLVFDTFSNVAFRAGFYLRRNVMDKYPLTKNGFADLEAELKNLKGV